MDTTKLITPQRSFGDILAETVPLVDVIAGFGPPVIFLGGPWLLLGLLLSAPFAALLTLIAAMVLAAALVAAVIAAGVAIVAAPYLLVRHVRRAYSADRTDHLVPVGSTPVAT
jgi:hypothetical protein